MDSISKYGSMNQFSQRQTREPRIVSGHKRNSRAERREHREHREHRQSPPITSNHLQSPPITADHRRSPPITAGSGHPATVQNDAAALGPLAGGHQLLRPGALPVPAGHAHPGRLHQLHAHRERGAAAGHPDQAALPRPERRHELRRRQLQLRPRLRPARLGVRGQTRADDRRTREEEEEEGEEQNRCCQVSQQEEGEDGITAEGVGEAGERQRRPEGSDRGAEAAEAAAGLHAQPAPAHLHRPGAERPDARGREEPLHPAHQGERLPAAQPHRRRLHRHVRRRRRRRAVGRRTPDAGARPLPRSPMRAASRLLFLRLRRRCSTDC